jgi:hypothetical protein
MKTCCLCGVEKAENDFAINRTKKDGRSHTCLVCCRARNKEWYEKNKKWKSKKLKEQCKERVKKRRKYIEEKMATIGCHFCHECDPIVLEFHHLKNKDGNVSTMLIGGISWQRLKAEIDKCVLLCANCHRRLHAGKIALNLSLIRQISLPDNECEITPDGRFGTSLGSDPSKPGS